MPDGATPRDAWNALKEERGITPEKAYNDLREKDEKREDKSGKDEALTEEQKKYIDAFKKDMSNYAVKVIEPKPRSGIPTDEEIINTIAGGDLTKGSCVSVGLAYIANKNGMFVTDFRGGRSQRLFSHGWANLSKIFNDKKATEYNGFESTEKVLAEMEKDKEYALVTGRHFSIVKRTDNGFKYLELQSPTDNGYKPLTKQALRDRFGVKIRRTLYHMPVKQNAYLIGLDKFSDNQSTLRDLVGYLNTDGKNEKKEINGSVK